VEEQNRTDECSLRITRLWLHAGKGGVTESAIKLFPERFQLVFCEYQRGSARPHDVMNEKFFFSSLAERLWDRPLCLVCVIHYGDLSEIAAHHSQRTIKYSPYHSFCDFHTSSTVFFLEQRRLAAEHRSLECPAPLVAVRWRPQRRWPEAPSQCKRAGAVQLVSLLAPRRASPRRRSPPSCQFVQWRGRAEDLSLLRRELFGWVSGEWEWASDLSVSEVFLCWSPPKCAAVPRKVVCVKCLPQSCLVSAKVLIYASWLAQLHFCRFSRLLMLC